jgi:hypothetical protein
MSGVLAAIAGGPTFFVETTAVSDNSPSPASAFITYESDGDVVATTALDGAVDRGDWISPKALAPGAYTVRAHVDSGSLDGASSAVDSDLALSVSRGWGVTQAVAGANTATITVTIKDGGGNSVAVGQIALTATATS